MGGLRRRFIEQFLDKWQTVADLSIIVNGYTSSYCMIQQQVNRTNSYCVIFIYLLKDDSARLVSALFATSVRTTVLTTIWDVKRAHS